MNKRVLIVSQVIPQWYVDLLTASLGEGAIIDIITGSEVKGTVIKSPEHDPKSFKTRLVAWYKHYRFMMKWIKNNKKANYDLIFCISNPPINPYIGLKLKKVFKAPFIYMNWDLYPQVIKTSIHNPIVSMACAFWSGWNSKNYAKIDRIITIGEVMASSMNSDLKKEIPVDVIPIGVDSKRLIPLDKKKNRFVIENDLLDKFIVLYSGKMGLGHNIEMILEASKRLQDVSDIVFVFIGFGPKYDLVNEYIIQNKPNNVKLFPLQNEDMFPSSVACGDIGIVTQEAAMAHLFMPSKVYSMMACGEAIVGIGSESDDLGKLIKNEQIGMTVTGNSVDDLVQCLKLLYNDKELLNNYKLQSRKVATEKYDLSVIKESYSQLFQTYCT